MSPQTPAEAAAAFADLLDVDYDPSADPDVTMLEMIGTARANGITWAQIGSVTIRRRDPKAAKRHARALAASVRQRAFAALPQEVNDA
jgi:hypothetical protein